MVMIVNPIMSEYPKCKDGIAAVVQMSNNEKEAQELLTILVAEPILSPYAASAIDPMHGVYEGEAASQHPFRSFHTLVI